MKRRTTRWGSLFVAVLAACFASSVHAQSARPRRGRPLPLGLLRALTDPPRESMLATADGLLVTRGNGERHLVVWDATTDREVSDLSASPSTRGWLMIPGQITVAGGAVIGANGGRILGVDLRTRVHRFETVAAPPGEIVSWTHEAQSRRGDLWFAAAVHFVPPNDEDPPTSPMVYELLALNTTDGHIAWRAPAAPSMFLGSDGDLVITVDTAGAMIARNGSDGVERWHAQVAPRASDPPCTGTVSMTVANDRIVVTCPSSRALVFDSASGAFVGAIDGAPNSMLRVIGTTRDGFVLAEYGAASPDGSQGRLYGYSGRRLVRRWTSAPRASAGYNLVHAAIAGDVILTCDDAGMVDAISLVDGSTVCSWGFARCVDVAAVGTGTSARFFVSHGDGVSVFSAAGNDVPTEHAQIEGTVTLEGAPWSGARVRVGTSMVTADARGHFSAAIDARGTVTVAVVSSAPEHLTRRGESLIYTSATPIRLEGRRTYSTRIATTAGHIDFGL